MNIFLIIFTFVIIIAFVMLAMFLVKKYRFPRQIFGRNEPTHHINWKDEVTDPADGIETAKNMIGDVEIIPTMCAIVSKHEFDEMTSKIIA